MRDAQGEEFKHFSMDLELPLRRTPPWRGLERDVDVVIGTLSKALGSYGAFACCSQELG